jgi:cytoskeletal protein RodZ
MTEGTLSQCLKDAQQRSKVDVDTLADRTKIPRATIRSLLGENVSVILPERVYLRGQVLTLARELGLDPNAAREKFDEENPVVQQTVSVDIVEPRFNAGTTVLAASLGCIALLAIVLAFVN